MGLSKKGNIFSCSSDFFPVRDLFFFRRGLLSKETNRKSLMVPFVKVAENIKVHPVVFNLVDNSRIQCLAVFPITV